MSRIKTPLGVSSKSSDTLAPTYTQEGQEKRCIARAYNLVEQRLIDGTATSQEVTFFLKLGCQQAKLETKRLENENLLIEQKIETLKSDRMASEDYKRVINAIKDYRGDSFCNRDVDDDIGDNNE